MTFIVEARAHYSAPWCRLYTSQKELDALRIYVERSSRFPRDYVRLVTGRGLVVSSHAPV